MAETQQNFPAGTTDPEATLVQPRFDESAAQVAQPVVPLSGARRGSQRSRLPVALVLVSALLGGLVSVLAYRLYQRPARAAQPATAQQAATQTQTTQQQPAPQPTQTPELTAAVPATEEPAPQPRVETATAPIKHEEPEERAADEEKPARAAEKKHEEEGKAREESKAREDRRREDEPRAARVAEPRSRRVDVIPSYPDGVVDERDTRRVGATDYEVPDERREGRRARRPKRRNIDRIRDIFGAPPPA